MAFQRLEASVTTWPICDL